MLQTPTQEQPGGIQLFTHPSFGTIRTAGDADNPLFCLKDLCKCLDLQASAVARRIPKGMISSHPLQTKGGLQKTSFVNEPGVYKVIFQSRKDEAEEFTNWVAFEVLTSIRKTGHYGVAPANPTPVSLEALENRAVSHVLSIVERAVDIAVERTLRLTAKGVTRTCTYTLSEIAQELDTTSETLRCLLVSIKILRPSRVIMAQTRAMEAEYFVNLPMDKIYVEQVIVTEKGREEILAAWPTYRKQHPYR